MLSFFDARALTTTRRRRRARFRARTSAGTSGGVSSDMLEARVGGVTERVQF
jgi:hypothetical protein